MSVGSSNIDTRRACTDKCVDMRICTCIGMFVDMFTDMCTGVLCMCMGIGMCIDMKMCFLQNGSLAYILMASIVKAHIVMAYGGTMQNGLWNNGCMLA